MAKKSRSGFNAEYLSGLSENADQSNILGDEVTKKHEELQQEIKAAAADPSRLQYIKISLLDNNPWQGRQSMDEEELKGLSADIKENGFHEAMPVVARPNPTIPGIYQIVWGHRRTRAAEMAGLEEVPVLVKEYSDEDMVFLQAKENLLREQLTPVDEAVMFNNMLQLGYTQERIAEKVKKSRGYIRNRLEILKGSEETVAMVKQDPETVRAVYYLNKVEDPALRIELIQALLDKKITGESIPGYLATLKEAQNKEKQQTVLLTESDTPSSAEASSISALPVPSSEQHGTRMESAPQSLAIITPSLLPEHTQDEIKLVANQPHEKQPHPSVEQVMEAGEQRGKELLEAGKLRTLLKQLQSYQNRNVQRQTPLSSEEISLLKGLEELAHALQETM